MSLLQAGHPSYGGGDQREICPAPSHDLQHLIRQLDGWFDNHDMPGMLKAEPTKLKTPQPVEPVDKLADREAKWGAQWVIDFGGWGRAQGAVRMSLTPGGPARHRTTQSSAQL